MINGKIDDRVCGYGPKVGFYIEKDDVLTQRKLDIFDLIKINHDAGIMYLDRFDYIHKFYIEDVALKAETIESERGSHFLFMSDVLMFHIKIINTK